MLPAWHREGYFPARRQRPNAATSGTGTGWRTPWRRESATHRNGDAAQAVGRKTGDRPRKPPDRPRRAWANRASARSSSPWPTAATAKAIRASAQSGRSSSSASRRLAAAAKSPAPSPRRPGRRPHRHGRDRCRDRRQRPRPPGRVAAGRRKDLAAGQQSRRQGRLYGERLVDARRCLFGSRPRSAAAGRG